MDPLHAWLEQHFATTDADYAPTLASARVEGLEVAAEESMIARLVFNGAAKSYRTLDKPICSPESPNRHAELDALQACREAVLGLAAESLRR